VIFWNILVSFSTRFLVTLLKQTWITVDVVWILSNKSNVSLWNRNRRKNVTSNVWMYVCIVAIRRWTPLRENDLSEKNTFVLNVCCHSVAWKQCVPTDACSKGWKLLWRRWSLSLVLSLHTYMYTLCSHCFDSPILCQLCLFQSVLFIWNLGMHVRKNVEFNFSSEYSNKYFLPFQLSATLHT
jgi:hypothetical protein